MTACEGRTTGSTGITSARRLAVLFMVWALVMGAVPFIQVSSESITTFSDGKGSQVLTFSEAGKKSVAVLVTDDATVTQAGFDIDVSEISLGAGYPMDLSVDVGGDGVVEWAFTGTDVGAAGHQFLFKDGKASGEVVLTDPAGGTDGSMKILLPKTARLKDASVWLSGNGTAVLPVTTRDIKAPGSEYNFGWSGANVGDVNADGWNDLLISSYGAPKAYLFSGGPSMDSVPELIFSGAANSNFGNHVAALGDVNKDGYDDFAISENGSLAVRVYFGGPNIDNVPDLNLTNPTGGFFGYYVEGGSDLDGDGINDIVVGDYYDWFADRGLLYVYKGGPQIDNVSDYNISIAQDVFMGHSLCMGGDITGDGYDDLVVGDPDPWGFSGGASIYIYKGGPGFGGMPISKGASMGIDDLFSWDMAMSDDINGDGIDDLVVGAPDSGPGKVYIFWGRANWPGAVAPSVTISGEATGDLFGFSVDTVGDLNSDGRSELLVGAPYYGGAKYNGKAYFMNGSASPTRQGAYEFIGAANSMTGTWVGDLGDLLSDGGHDFAFSSLGSNLGKGDVQLYRPTWGLGAPTVNIGGVAASEATLQVLNGTKAQTFDTDVLQGKLGSALIAGSDKYGNQFVELTVTLGAASAGRMGISGLSMNYTMDTSGTMGLEKAFESYLSARRQGGTIGAKVTVPITISSSTAGRVVLSGLSVECTMNKAPVAYIDSMDPASPIETGAFVSLAGHGTDDGGTIVAYNWSSDLEGLLGNGPSIKVNLTTVGTHTISLKVQDNMGRWSEPRTTTMVVIPKNIAPTVTIDSPTEGKTVSKVVTITGHAADADIGDTLTVEIDIDGNGWLPAAGGSGGSAWVFRWDTANETDGGHTIKARSFDGKAYSAHSEVNVTVTHPVPGIKVTPPAVPEAYPGDRITMFFNVTNTGTGPGDFELKVRTNPSAQVELTTLSVHITAGNWTNVKVVVYVDKATSAPSDLEVGLKAQLSGDLAIWDEGVVRIKIIPKPPNPADQGAYIEVPAGQTVKAGTEVIYLFKVRNTGTVADTYEILAFSKNGWATTMTIDASAVSGPVTIDAGKNVEIAVKVQVPKNAKGRTAFETTLTVRSQYFPAVNLTKTVMTTVKAEPVRTSVVSLPVVQVAIIATVAIGCAISAVVLGTEWGTFGLFWLLIPLYTRIKKEAVLDNFKRGEINAFIKLNPGTYYNEIKKNLDVSNGVLTYHLNRLEMEGYIKSKVNGRYKHYFPVDMKTPDKIVMLNDLQRALLKFIRDKRWVTQAEISEQLDIPLPTVSRHLKRLMEAEMVTVERRGNLNYYGVRGDMSADVSAATGVPEQAYSPDENEPQYQPSGYPSGYQAGDGQPGSGQPDYDPAGYKYYQPPEERPPDV